MQKHGYSTSTCVRQEEDLRNSIIKRRTRASITCAEKLRKSYPDLTALLWCSTRIQTSAGRVAKYSIWSFFALLLFPQKAQRRSLISLASLLVMMVLSKKNMSSSIL